MKYLLLPLLILSLTGCEDEVSCTTSVEPGIYIDVVDAQTNKPISCGITATLQDSNYEEVLTNPDSQNCSANGALQGAYERPGFYNVTVQKEGYEYWYAYNIEVTSSKCHVNTEYIEVQLKKVET